MRTETYMVPNPFDAIRESLRSIEDNYVRRGETEPAEPSTLPQGAHSLGLDERGQQWENLKDPAGVRLKTRASQSNLEARVSHETSGISEAVLTDDEGEVLERQDATPGEWVAFDTDLEGNSKYRLVVDSGGEQYTRGRAQAAYPLGSDGYEITHGVYSGDLLSEDYRYGFDAMSADAGELPEASEPSESDEDEDEPKEKLDLGGADNETQTAINNQSGVVIEPKEDIDGLGCRLSENVGRGDNTPQQARLRRVVSDDEIETVEKVSTGHYGPGQTFNFQSQLEAGEKYQVVLWSNGDDYTRGKRTGMDYPIEGDTMSVTAGVYHESSDSENDTRYNVSELVAGNFREGDGPSFADLTPDRGPSEIYVGDEDDIPVPTLTIPNRTAAEEINVVEDSRIDETGDVATQIQEFLEDQDTIDHEFFFPNGEYLWNREIQFGELEFVRFRGESETGVVLNNTEQIRNAFRFINHSSHVEIENFVLDITGEGSDGYPLDAGLCHIIAEDYLFVDNLRLRGERHYGLPKSDDSVPTRMRGGKFTGFCNVSSEDGQAYVRRLTVPDGDKEYTDNQFDHSICLSSDPPHEGTIVWDSCEVNSTADNGFYLAHAPGDVFVIDSFAKNNGGTNIRLGSYGGGADVAVNCRVEITNGGEQATPGTACWIQKDGGQARHIEITAPEAGNDMLRANSTTDNAVFKHITAEVGEGSRCRLLDLSKNSDTDEQGVVFDDLTVIDYSEETDLVAINCTRDDGEIRNSEIDCRGRSTHGLERMEIDDATEIVAD